MKSALGRWVFTRAERGAIQSSLHDELNRRPLRSQWGFSSIARRCRPDADCLFVRWFQTQCDRLIPRLRSTSEWDTAKGVLRACIRDDRRLLRQHLSFVLDFEFYLRAYLRVVLEAELGSDWQTKLLSEFPVELKSLSNAYEVE